MQLIEDLDGGKFIQQNVESLLRGEEGRQLLAEVIIYNFPLSLSWVQLVWSEDSEDSEA